MSSKYCKMPTTFIVGCAAVALMTVLHLNGNIAPVEPLSQTTSRRQQNHLHLLQLPREIRDHIYHYAWSGTSMTVSSSKFPDPKAVFTANYYHDHSDDVRRIGRMPRWLCTNRQVRVEGLEQWYQKAEFSLARSRLNGRDFQAMQCWSRSFNVTSIKKLVVHEIIAALNRSHSVANGNGPTTDAGVVVESAISRLLARYVRQGMSNLRQVTLVVEWLPYSITSDQQQDIDVVFKKLLPKQLQAVEVVFISEYDLPELNVTASTLLNPRQFSEVQQSLTRQCRRLVEAHVEGSEVGEENDEDPKRCLRVDKCKKIRVYQHFRAGLKRLKSRTFRM